MKILLIILFTVSLSFSHTGKEPYYSKSYKWHDAYPHLVRSNGYINVWLIDESKAATAQEGYMIVTNAWIYHHTIYPANAGASWEGYRLWKTVCPVSLREKPTTNSRIIMYLKPGDDRIVIK